MTGIAEFLAARLDEDERIARAAMDELTAAYAEYSPAELASRDAGAGLPPDERPGIRHHGLDAWWAFAGVHQRPSRALAEVTAKRAVLAWHEPYQEDPHAVAVVEDGIEYGVTQLCDACAGRKPVWPCLNVRALAAPYADHPDFNPSWRIEEPS